MGHEHRHQAAAPAPKSAIPVPHQDVTGPSAPFPVAMIVGHAEDPAEVDADRRADIALNRLLLAEPFRHSVGHRQLRRSADPAAAGEAVVGWAGGVLDGGTSNAIALERGGGQQLSGDIRTRMEGAFGASFSRVRVHHDDGAARLNRQVSASAFTTGQDVFFGRGQYAPHTPSGEKVLAHELAHTLQPATATRRDVVRVAGASESVIRRNVIAGDTTYHQGVDSEKIAAAVSVASKNPVLAAQIARWMLSQDHPQEFKNGDALTKYVAELVDAVTAVQASFWVANNAIVEPVPWPEARTFKKLGRGDFNKMVVQVPQERGDMHDIRAAMLIDPKLYVLVNVEDSRRLVDAAIIVDYYRGFGARVMLACGHKLADHGGYARVARNASSTTEILFQEAADKPNAIAGKLQQATTGDAHVTLKDQYDTALKTTFHFPDGSEDRPYALINFRVSGHGVAKPRLPSHPELDTGTTGFGQIWTQAKNSGYWPVPVGGIPDNVLTGCIIPGGSDFQKDRDPSLVDYFKGLDPVKKAATEAGLNLSNRQIEYGVFGRLAAKFRKTRAIGMRSGGLDAIAYSGIPSISIDLAADYDPDVDSLDESHGHPSSWKRAAKKELLLPGKFHQVFMDALRPVVDLENPGWEGALTDSDVTRIGKALTTFFGGWGQAGVRTQALQQQPLPKAAPEVLPDDVRNLMTKLSKSRPDAGLLIKPGLAAALGIRKF